MIFLVVFVGIVGGNWFGFIVIFVRYVFSSNCFGFEVFKIGCGVCF